MAWEVHKDEERFSEGGKEMTNIKEVVVKGKEVLVSKARPGGYEGNLICKSEAERR